MRAHAAGTVRVPVDFHGTVRTPCAWPCTSGAWPAAVPTIGQWRRAFKNVIDLARLGLRPLPPSAEAAKQQDRDRRALDVRARERTRLKVALTSQVCD